MPTAQAAITVILALALGFVKQGAVPSSSAIPAKKPPLPPRLVLLAGVLATSTSAILVRYAQEDAPSLVIATGRLSLATLLLMPLALRRAQELQHLPRHGWWLALLSGFLLGLHFAGYISALRYTSIAAATVLATSTPIWVGLAAPLALGERLTRYVIAGLVLALPGAVLIGLEGGAAGTQSLLGNALALSSALTGAAYLIIGRRLRPHLSLVAYTGVVYGMAALTLLLMTVLAGQPLVGYPPHVYVLFLLMALFPQLLGHSSYNYALAFLPVAYVSIAVISEPVGASLLGWLLFGEIPGPATIFGGLLIASGVLLASSN
jgi:drug/metabolite transporter (DMT)-like permease